MILRLVRRKQCLPAERFDPDKHFEAARSTHQTDEFFLFCNLRVALREKRNADVLRNHLFEQFFGFGVLVEIVGGKHYQTDTCGLRVAKTFHRRCDRLAANLPAGDFVTEQKLQVKGSRARDRCRASARHNGKSRFQEEYHGRVTLRPIVDRVLHASSWPRIASRMI